MPKRESGQFVVPGEKLGVVEEFVPGLGTLEEEGTIYSSSTGLTLVDLLRKTVSVQACTKSPVTPREGDVVLGVASSVQERVATLNIFKIGQTLLEMPFSGFLHISNTSPRYERHMSDVCKAGDVVKARIVNVKNRVLQLGTMSRELGVVRAFCSRCGGPLLSMNRTLRCQNCGNAERRKMASDYGKEAT